MTTSSDLSAAATNSAVDVDVFVVGAGITGIYQLYRAIEEGYSALLLEAGSGVGGTWYWNRYPGARFDSESYTYGYLFSKDLFDEWRWREHFAPQPETEMYLNHVVDRFDLRRHIRFDSRVTAAEYDERSGTWQVHAGASLEQQDGKACLARPVELIDAGYAGADDEDVDFGSVLTLGVCHVLRGGHVWSGLSSMDRSWSRPRGTITIVSFVPTG